AGLRYVAMSPNLLRVNLRGFLFGLAGVAMLALLPLVAKENLHGTAIIYGMLLGCFGFGAVIAALANARLRERFRNEYIARGSFIATAISCTVVALSPYAIVSGLALLLAGACWVLALSILNVTIQLSTPRWVVGRALALYQTCTFGGMTIGSLLWGTVAQHFGSPTALLSTAVVLAFGAAVGVRLPLPEFEGLNLDPLNRFREPALQLDLNYRSGPVMIMVDYIIDRENTQEFLVKMAQRRRIRIRDGAQQWVLLRDLEQPEVWSESYHFPTWGEYVRHNERHTQADAEVTDRIRELHRGPGRPVVHRMIERQTVPLHDDMPLKPPREE
ncbi:MFS transporter, partial [Pseudorhodobacter sp.]|uniref:MFS transporter n=1 Tax=Pseudorhodobacter sp. TaxID=1934400 RepID=UPI0026492573